jgi:amino acid permease
MVSFYIVLVIFFESVLCHGTSPTLGEGFKQAHQKTDIEVLTIFNCLPLIIFAFMYQINIPAIYGELSDKSMKTITQVLTGGTSLAAILYIITGIFGIVAFAACNGAYPINFQAEPPVEYTYASIMDIQNILQAPWADGKGKTPVAIYVCLFGILIVITFASPFCVLPMKDSIEEVRGKGKLDPKTNAIVTILICVVCSLMSFGLTSLGTVATLLGATTNSAIGFWLPILFYLRVERKGPKWTNTKIAAYIMFGFVAFSSVMTLGLMVARAINNSGNDKPDMATVVLA